MKESISELNIRFSYLLQSILRTELLQVFVESGLRIEVKFLPDY